MAATTRAVGTIGNQKLIRIENTSDPDTSNALALAFGHAVHILQVLVSYSAAPTAAAPTSVLTTGAGAEHTIANGLSTNTQHQRWVPTQLHLMDNDSLALAAPAGGGVITSTITVYALAP